MMQMFTDAYLYCVLIVQLGTDCFNYFKGLRNGEQLFNKYLA